MSDNDFKEDGQQGIIFESIEVFLIIIFYIDFMFSIWDWVELDTFYTLVDKMYIVIQFSEISLMPYIFSKIYEIVYKLRLYVHNDESKEKIVTTQIKRIKKVFTIVYGVILFVLSRLTEFIEFDSNSEYLFGVLLIEAILLGFLIIIPNKRGVYAIVIYIWIVLFIIAIVLSSTNPSTSKFHITLNYLFGYILTSSSFIVGVVLTSNYLVNKKMKDTWKKVILHMDNISWKTYIQVYKFHILGFVVIWSWVFLCLNTIGEGITFYDF